MILRLTEVEKWLSFGEPFDPLSLQIVEIPES